MTHSEAIQAVCAELGPDHRGVVLALVKYWLDCAALLLYNYILFSDSTVLEKDYADRPEQCKP
jgi:hypothetical protein